ncbi:hypothetical protein ACFFWD_18155 [Bradyrhizobium erythrophlei]|uniref:hypothetical protein n=1 Tax=Bradyrhizobium erythrophlei TaxID=1437360 RepID=UPI0035EABD8A
MVGDHRDARFQGDQQALAERADRMTNRLLAIVLVAAVIIDVSFVRAQTPTEGAAARAGKGWAYPEPASRGATGFSPDYSQFNRLSERWDIYFNILWRKSGTSNRDDIEYYDDQLHDLLETMPPAVRALGIASPALMQQIRSGQVKLPYRDAITGCLLFMAKHDKRMIL